MQASSLRVLQARCLHHKKLALVRDFKPLAGGEMKDLLTRTAPAAATGKHEAFKTTSEFDATAHNPQWLG